MPKSKRPESDYDWPFPPEYPPGCTYTPKAAIRRMFNERAEAERKREAWRRRREELPPRESGLPEPPEPPEAA